MRVVIAEDEALLRAGLVLLLEEAGFEIVAQAGDAPALLAAVAAHRPDVVLTDIAMPPGNGDDGLHAAIAIRAAYRGIGVLVLSQHVNRQYAHDLLGQRSDGVGYLLKQRVADVDDFCAAIRTVARGGLVLDPEVVTVMLNRARRTTADVDRLTPRELETLRHLAEGRSNGAIGRTMRITERAVVNHIGRIYAKLDLPDSTDDHRRVLAVIRYLDA